MRFCLGVDITGRVRWFSSIMKTHIALSLMALGSFLLASCDDKREQEKPAIEDKREREKPAIEDNGKQEKPAIEDKGEQEKPAIGAFTKQVADLGIVEDLSALEELEANAEENPAALFEAVGALAKKFEEVNTDGLPADLEENLEAMKSGFSDLAEHFMAMPIPLELLKDEAAMTEWITEKATADPEFPAKFQEEMGAWEKKAEELGTKLEEMDWSVFEKYGIGLE